MTYTYSRVAFIKKLSNSKMFNLNCYLNKNCSRSLVPSPTAKKIKKGNAWFICEESKNLIISQQSFFLCKKYYKNL